MRRGECLASLSSRIMLNAELFEDEEGASTLEGMRRVLGGDRRPDVAVPGVEAAEEVQDLTQLGDRVADVAELIGNPLELGAVFSHGHVTLLQGAQLSLQVHSALQLIILEQTFDGVPQSEGVVAVAADDVEDAL